MRSRTSLSRNDSAVIMPAPPQLSEQCPSADGDEGGCGIGWYEHQRASLSALGRRLDSQVPEMV
jgi:hypothetical protein